MPVHTTADGTSLVYDDWGTGRPVVLDLNVRGVFNLARL